MNSIEARNAQLTAARERIWARVFPLPAPCPDDCDVCCCHDAVCVCPDDREPGPFDDDGDQDFLFEQARDRRYFDD